MDISNNKINYVDPSLFTNLTKLTVIYAQNNVCKNQDVEATSQN